MDQNFSGFCIIRRGNTTHSCLGCQSDCRACIFKGFGDRFKMAAAKRWSMIDNIPKNIDQLHKLNDEAIILIFTT